jgi:hypothetical protein
MSIQTVILFISSTSESCKPVVKFVVQNEIPVKIIRLDTAEDRKNAMNGKYFQLQSVPTLLVMYTDDNIQLFVGKEKIISWFDQISQKRKKQADRTEEESSEEEEEIVKPPKKIKKKVVLKKPILKQKETKLDKKKPKKAVVFADSSSEEEEEIEFYDKTETIIDHVDVNPKIIKLQEKKPESIYDIAKNMEKEREKNLGYNGKD